MEDWNFTVIGKDENVDSRHRKKAFCFTQYFENISTA